MSVAVVGYKTKAVCPNARDNAMYLVLMEMSCSSVRRKRFFSSDIMVGDQDVKWVSTLKTDLMSS